MSTTKIPTASIELHRAEGVEALRTVTGEDCWRYAESTLCDWAETAPTGGAYDKCDITVTWADGTVRRFRYDLHHPSYEPVDIVKFVRSECAFLSGRWHPSHMTDAQHRQLLDCLAAGTREYHAKLLDHYQIG